MLVRQIIAGKSMSGTVSVPGRTTVAEAARILVDRKIGTVIVSEDGKGADGILSERDIVRELAAKGPGCLDQPIETIMTRDLVTCTPEDKANAIMQAMTDGRFRHMPVLEGGELVALVSLGDVVKAVLQELEMEKGALEGMIMGH